MGRVFDFAKRRIAGYIVFWVLVLFFLIFFYGDDRPAQAGGSIILGLAFLGSLLYTRRMKRRQRARREATEAAQAAEAAHAARAAHAVQTPQAIQGVPPPRAR